MAVLKIPQGAILAASLSAALLPTALLPAAAEAQTHRSARDTHVTEDGTVVHRSGHATRTAYGETGRRGRAVAVEPDGDVSRQHGACVHHYGGSACSGREASVDRRSDGSIYRESERGAFTPYGEASSSGSFHHDPDGNYHGQRSASGANGRGSFHADATIDDETGYRRDLSASGDNGSVDIETEHRRGEDGSRTVTCYNTAGAVVACPY